MAIVKILDGTGRHRTDDLTKYPEEKARFVDWLCLPEKEREPASMAKMADALGVSGQTLRNWKRDPIVISQVKNRLQSVISIQYLPGIVESLRVQAMDPDHPRSVQASKLLIEMMEKAESSQVEIPLAEKSNEELKVMAAALYDEFDDRSQTA